ncbi:MAG: DUF6512 family protein [Paracoccaceae bacterium]|nr:DUF6512 family protein [Paracoccaceae bacterium]
MTPRSRAILRWEITGAIFTILVGSALHFVFGWTGGWRPVALIAAVNESIWEHLKLAFWPGLFWALLPRRGLELPLQGRLAGKGIALTLTAVLIVMIFKSYTAILGHNLLPLDIGTFVLAVMIGQIVSAALSIYGMPSPAPLAVGLSLLVIQLAAYAFFTFYPPDFWLFIDSRNGLRGIPPT